MKNFEKEARDHADKIWGTEDLKDLSEFNIPLSSAVNMMSTFASEKVSTALSKSMKIVDDTDYSRSFETVREALQNAYFSIQKLKDEN